MIGKERLNLSVKTHKNVKDVLHEDCYVMVSQSPMFLNTASAPRCQAGWLNT